LERIIKASSAKGDVVADFFCGCGTTIDAAIRLKRNYIGADILPVSVALTQKRIKDAHGHAPNSHYSLRGLPREFDWRQEPSPARSIRFGTSPSRQSSPSPPRISHPQRPTPPPPATLTKHCCPDG